MVREPIGAILPDKQAGREPGNSALKVTKAPGGRPADLQEDTRGAAASRADRAVKADTAGRKAALPMGLPLHRKLFHKHRTKHAVVERRTPALEGRGLEVGLRFHGLWTLETYPMNAVLPTLLRQAVASRR